MAKNVAHSVKVRLLNLCDHDNRRYQQVLIRYMHERFLYRLSKSRYRRNLILKGGSLLYAFDEFIPRPTLDVDFMGISVSNKKDDIIRAFEEISKVSIPEDGMLFLPDSIEASDIALERKYPGVRIAIVGMLDTIRKDLIFDIGFGDVITPNTMIMSYPVLLDEMDAPELDVYSLETVIAEKFQTMVEKSEFNSRMKDYFDIYRIVTVKEFEEKTLLEALRNTFQNRGTSFNDAAWIFSDEYKHNSDLNRRWNTFRKKTKLECAPEFGQVMEIITKYLYPYWEKLK